LAAGVGCPHIHASSTDRLALFPPLGERSSLVGMKLFNRLRSRIRATLDAGMTTAEYAVGTVAAVAFAVVLYKIVRSPAVSATLASVIQSALHAL
jgi:hypothetical protein